MKFTFNFIHFLFSLLSIIVESCLIQDNYWSFSSLLDNNRWSQVFFSLLVQTRRWLLTHSCVQCRVSQYKGIENWNKKWSWTGKWKGWTLQTKTSSNHQNKARNVYLQHQQLCIKYNQTIEGLNPKKHIFNYKHEITDQFPCDE